MNFQFLTGDFKISKRRFIVATLLTSGTLAWFFLLQAYINEIIVSITQDFSWADKGRILFFGVGVFSAIAGSFVGGKVDRRKFLWVWITLGIISTASLVLFQGIVFCVISSILLGLSLGFGLPASMAFLADCTSVEERGRISGVTILETFVIAFLVMALARILDLGILTTIILITVVRSISLLALILEETEEKKVKENVLLLKPDYREFTFYLIPWITFVIVAGLAWNLIPLTDELSSTMAIGNVFRYGFMAIFGFVWGVIADRMGRKQPLIIGLILLGVGFGLLGFARRRAL